MAPWRSGWLACMAACLPGIESELVQQALRAAVRAQQDLPQIQISGRQVLVDGAPLHIKGVCYSPVPKGETIFDSQGRPENSDGLKWADFAEQDSTLMQQAGINAIRLYFPLLDTSILDIFWGKGIYVIQPAYNGLGERDDVSSRIAAVKNHPSILFWEVGNEWNYNKFYKDQEWSYEKAVNVTKETAALVKSLDPTRPVVSVYGEMPPANLVDEMVDIDIWALNVYRFNDFGTLFQEWSQRSNKPMYIGEFGADAWNALIDMHDPENQSLATVQLTGQINANSVVGDPAAGVCSGGVIFEFADEWWKDMSENSSVWEHDVGGIAPGGGPWPDRTFNEEYWGLCDIDRNPRPAFTAYQNIDIPQPPPPTTTTPDSSSVCATVWAIGALIVLRTALLV